MEQKVISLVGDDNQIYLALVLEGRPIRTLCDSRVGPMSFTVLEVIDGYKKTDR